MAVPAPESARRRGLRHLRLPRGPGGAAGLDGPAGAPLSRAAPGGERGLLKARRDPPAAQAQNLQALCLECHRNKTALEFSHATTLESHFSRRAYEAYVESPRLPPLVFKLNSHKPERICYGIDVVARTPWPTASSRHPSSAPRTTWSKPARGTWRT